ncbi:MAG: 3-dehydroquinate synthase [Clostridia bacterium]
MKTIKVNTQNSYDIVLDENLSELADYLSNFNCEKVLIVTDTNIEKLYLSKVKQLIANKIVCSFTINCGESSKNFSNYQNILNYLAQNNFARNDFILALGGGVVGDLAGFVASTYMRGINFAQVPTTLLAMVDSSIGGKTAINLSYGKNLVGSFYQPKKVFCNVDFLKTLPKSEWENGYGEVIKYAILKGGKLFDCLKNGLFKQNLSYIIEECVKYKSEIVQQDELELGNRKLLNLGHTFAHAIEKNSNYTIPHGIAVAKGIQLIATASNKNENFSTQELQDVLAILKPLTFDVDIKNLLKDFIFDKKIVGDCINLIVIKSIGNCQIKPLKINKLEEYFL